MWEKHLLPVVLLGTLLVTSGPARGQGEPVQVHGMFGDRELGRPLKPRPGTLLGAGMTNSYGGFVGRGRSPGLQFPNMPWQRPVATPSRPAWTFERDERYQPSEPAIVKRRPLPASPSQPSPAPVEETTPPLPDQWFRLPATRARAAAPPDNRRRT